MKTTDAPGINVERALLFEKKKMQEPERTM